MEGKDELKRTRWILSGEIRPRRLLKYPNKRACINLNDHTCHYQPLPYLHSLQPTSNARHLHLYFIRLSGLHILNKRLLQRLSITHNLNFLPLSPLNLHLKRGAPE